LSGAGIERERIVRNKLSWLALCGAALLLVGCGSGPRTYKVVGTVTLDGEPLPDGDIQFLPQDRALSIDGGRVEDGEFEFQAKPGTKKVSIRAARPAPGLKAVNGDPINVDYIPDRYNSKTTLTAEVAAKDKNEFEFKLTSKPAAK
jgi:hypothetical protein